MWGAVPPAVSELSELLQPVSNTATNATNKADFFILNLLTTLIKNILIG
ncbi:hypothetical protein VCR29J2_700356 [Vibrio coralliirubri]|nr:hypothetical protein VCR29J2_700356 [Vibrio coralliirubri]